LKVRRNKKKTFIKDTPISSDFSHLLLNVLNTGKLLPNDYNNLSEDEKNIFDNIISSGYNGSGGSLSYTRYNQQDIDALINRYNIIKGEILIGNNNPDLLKELKITVLRLVHYNVISMKEITPLLEHLFLLM
jgi:hypothetical protein